MIKVSKKTLTRYISEGRIFDWGEANRKSHVMTSSIFFEKRNFLLNKDIVEWRIIIGGLGWHVSWIMRKGKDLKQKLKRF